MSNTNEKYVFGRSKMESQRLDAQHNLLVKATQNTLVHPSIPKEKVISVADIATGTGVWLRDTADLLGKVNTTQRYYHGFDISPDQFPDYMGDLEFSVHDITAPFPKEHWNRYDLVHVRLLVAAIDEIEYKAAVANIHQILKPGGFLQWEEIDEVTYKLENNIVFEEIWRCFDSSFKAEGKCFQASAKVLEECMAAGYSNVERLAYSSDWDNNLRPDTEARFVAIIETLYASLLLRSGQVDDELAASKQAGELIKKYRQLCGNGNSPPVKLMRVVAQKQTA
ncbi:unnamed protein product [Penicillium pancosmium]